ncbi:hypothetical protein GCM10023189_31600 [Nibrella saemangeumensis]|uniref:Uncharacterized protein n=1 Tax=Nibrella saemangeumensis TaxID=1084526 RepID=A0ABP8N253_9BACT
MSCGGGYFSSHTIPAWLLEDDASYTDWGSCRLLITRKTYSMGSHTTLCLEVEEFSEELEAKT